MRSILNRLFSRSEPIPFSKFDGWLKSLNTESFNQLQKAAVEASFARFFSDAAENAGQARATERVFGAALRGKEPPYRFRRFAGGRHFPARRYFAVCHNETGHDGGTLQAELTAYVDPRKSGPVYINDLADPLYIGLSIRYRSNNPEFPRHAIAVTFQKQNGWQSPHFQALKSAAGLQSGPYLAHNGDYEDIVTIYLPANVKQAAIDKVIDLRRPEVRAWMTRHVFAGIPTLRYLYADAYRADRANLITHSTPELHLDAPSERRAAADEAQRKSAKLTGQLRFYASQFAPDENRLGTPVPVEHREALILRLLTTTAEGGSPITEGIGAWLRTLGAEALIYPSARMNASVTFKNGTIADFSGFNLVDYRGTPPPEPVVRLVHRPVTTIDFAHLHYPVSTSPPTEPSLTGSFIIRGVAERQEEILRHFEAEAKARQAPEVTRKPIFPESMLRPVFRLENGDVCSVRDMRGLASAKTISLSDTVTSIETGQEGQVGGWLLSMLRMHDQDHAGNINWSGEWFCWFCLPHAADNCLFAIICPVCEARDGWAAATNEPVPKACGVCGFSEPLPDSETKIRQMFASTHRRLSGK